MTQELSYSPFEPHIAGHSGCYLELSLDHNQNPIFIKKSSHDPSYMKRLWQQASKQSDFSEYNRIPYFITPKISTIEMRATSGHFIMEYSPSLSFIEFFTNATIEEIDLFVQSAIQLIEQSIHMSVFKEIERQILELKLQDLMKKIAGSPLLDSSFKEELSQLLSNQLKVSNTYSEIPIGYCHGDLTFSNMLFKKSSRQTVLIDFLDSFIESPIQDLVKLRQDTRYYWSLNLLKTAEYDDVKIKIILDYIDARLHSYFSRYQFYNDWYRFFQLINFSRIIPYAKDKKIAEYLIFTISKMKEEFL